MDGAASLQGWGDLLFDCFVFYPQFWTSVIYAAVITLAQLVVIIPCAFGFSQAKFRGKSALFVFYIILMMMPLHAIILPAIFSPFGVVVMNQYMKNIDGSVIEAARLETNSVVRIMLVSVVPQLRVCIFAVALFVFADCWNMLEQPMLFLRDTSLQTVPVFISNAADYAGSVMFPAAVVFMVPVLLIYLFFSENLEKGLTIGDLS